jgi:hypothetical protein
LLVLVLVLVLISFSFPSFLLVSLSAGWRITSWLWGSSVRYGITCNS